jgi:hypothetical protein
MAAETERTQVIPVRTATADPDRTRPLLGPDASDTEPGPHVDDRDRPHFVPGFDRADEDGGRTQPLNAPPSSAAGEASHRAPVTADEETQVIHPKRLADG